MNLKEKFETVKTNLTPSDDTKALLKSAATQIVVGVAVSVAVKVATDLVVEQIDAYRGKETVLDTTPEA